MNRYRTGHSGNATADLVEILLVVFVVLKLCGLIDWSWWWVLSPLWITAAIAVVSLVVLGLFLLVEKRRLGR
jgi:hypothetical protein